MLDGEQGSACQLRVSGVCEGGSTISAINEDGTVICQGLPVEPAVPAGSVSFSLDATHVCVPNQSCPPTTYHLTLVHELDGFSPVLFERLARGGVLQDFTPFVQQPGRIAYLELDAGQVTVTGVLTERGPGVGPLETVMLSFESLGDPVWTTAGGPMPVPGDFPGQERVGTSSSKCNRT